MLGIFSMFFILFRNVKLSFIGVVPNFIAAFFILGIIGLLGIPLDMMTITIAAITIGIAVDNSIHYIYRFKEEFLKINDYNKTLDRCHSTVGIAILNTSITIVFGFAILILSNFIPTIYFGVFTGIAMLLAMISVLTLLPKLILTLQPFGNEINNKINE
jgi:predicted RND superfamily exporter protein